MPNSLPKTLTVAAAISCTLATAAQAAITISTHKTKDESCAAGVCTPTGPNPNIRVKDLEKLLAHSDIKIVTGQGSTGIGVLDPLTWASKHRLTLDANQSINVRAPVVVEGTGGVTLITNDGGTGGDYAFDAPGSLTFWDMTSSLIINGQSFTLVKDIATLASDITANASGNYALADNYDASLDGTYSSAPIPAVSSTVEGLGNTISNFNLTIVSLAVGTEAGLFGTLASTGVLRDINIAAANLQVTQQSHKASPNVGILVGESWGGIVGTNTSGSISGRKAAPDVGGLAGWNHGTILRSSSSAEITFKTNGIAGGLVGYSNGSVLLSHATGAVTALRGSAAGLVSVNSGRIEQCFATGAVSGADAGGLVGTDILGPGVTVQSYATGSVTAVLKDHETGYAGGLVWMEMGTYSQVYATGKVVGNANSPAGGFAGYSWKTTGYDAAYWDTTTSEQQKPAGDGSNPPVTGLTDDQLKSALPAGFDPNVWGQNPNINNGWPYLLANPPQ